MLNTKETLKRLHKKFPMMGLDELFEVLDCYIEESMTDYKKDSIVWYTTGDNENINKIDTTADAVPAIYTISSNGKANTTANINPFQLTTSH